MDIILSRIFPEPIVENIITYSEKDVYYYTLRDKTIKDIKLKFMCYKKKKNCMK